MASDTKRQNAGSRIPVALPRSESAQSAANLTSHEVSLQMAVGARVRINTGPPNQTSIEGTIYTADPITNLVVINTSLTTKPSVITASSLAAPAGSYRIIPISQIASFQILSLPTASTNTTEAPSIPATLDSAAIQTRLSRAIHNLQQEQSRQGPKGTTPSDQQLFNALSRTHPAVWASSAMLISDTYLIEKPYLPANVRLIDGAKGDLERMRKVIDMERNKVVLKMGKSVIDGRMGGEKGEIVKKGG